MRIPRAVRAGALVTLVPWIAPTPAIDRAPHLAFVPTAMPLTVPLDRTLALASAHAFGRLRALLRQHPVPIADVIAQARDCGGRAAAAEMRLDLMVDVLVGVVPAELHGPRSLPESLIDAAVEAYLVAAEGRGRASAAGRVGAMTAA